LILFTIVFSAIFSYFMLEREKQIKRECAEGKAFCYAIEESGEVHLGFRRDPLLTDEEMEELFIYF
jgi:hypothetical protein